MKSQQILVTSANSPLTIPLDPRGGSTTFGATPAGAGNYTVEFSVTPLQQNLTLNTFAITDMTAATTPLSNQSGPVTALVVTLNSGTSVTIDLSQSDK